MAKFTVTYAYAVDAERFYHGEDVNGSLQEAVKVADRVAAMPHIAGARVRNNRSNTIVYHA